ncbi:MAG: hypothetical protein OER88_06950, partial [Planctomycetota bacterium]|nr:hypothetical protein [Planctomycetota bacterium]
MRSMPLRAAAVAALVLTLAALAFAQTPSGADPPPAASSPLVADPDPAPAATRRGPPPVDLECPDPMLRGISIECTLIAS